MNEQQMDKKITQEEQRQEYAYVRPHPRQDDAHNHEWTWLALVLCLCICIAASVVAYGARAKAKAAEDHAASIEAGLKAKAAQEAKWNQDVQWFTLPMVVGDGKSYAAITEIRHGLRPDGMIVWTPTPKQATTIPPPQAQQEKTEK